MSTVFLRVKIKSLAAEAGIIRREERAFPHGRRESGGLWDQLNRHRRQDVRSEARAAQLAYGLLRGRAYRQLEATCYEPPNTIRVRDLLLKYGHGRNLPLHDKSQTLTWIEQWMNEGRILPTPARQAAQAA